MVQSNEVGKAKSKLFSGILGIISAVLLIYTVVIQFMLTEMDWHVRENLLFGIPAEKMGPFISMQFLIIAVLQLVIWLSFIFINIYHHNAYGAIQNISLAGSFIAFAFISLLKELSSVEVVGLMRNQILLVFLVEWIAVSSILILIKYKIDKNVKNN